MATQTVTVQVDQGMADIVRALMAKIEASGKSTAEFFAQMEAAGQALVVKRLDGKMIVLQDSSSYQKAMQGEEESDRRQAIRRQLEEEELDLAESREAVRQGLADAAAGRTMSLNEFAAKMRASHGFPETRPVRQ